MSLYILLFLILVATTFYTYGNWLGYYSILFSKKVHTFPRDWTYKPKITVMISSFNESRDVYECIKSVMASDYPTDLIQVVGIDDCSIDDTFEWMRKAAAEWPNNVHVQQNAANSGKPTNLINLAKMAIGDIYFSIDSDTILDVRAISECVSCFSSPDVGAIGAQVRVKNLNDSVFSRYQGLKYVMQFYFLKSIENQALASRCLYGPMVAYRAHVYQQLIKLVPGRNWLGATITYGEDAYLTTNLCIGRGVDRAYKVFNNLNAIVWTGQPATATKYMNQQMRWWRGTSANAFAAIHYLITNLNKVKDIKTSSMFIVILPSIAQIAGMMMFFYLIATGQFLQTYVDILIWISTMGVLECCAYNIMVGSNDPIAGPIKNPITTGIFCGIWMPVIWILLPFVAIFTLDDGGWVTRQNVGNV